MRQALAQFAHENPVMRASQTKKTHAISSPYSFMRKTRSYKIVSATVIGGLLIGGTVSFAAEGVLPGNVLYPVKTQVNERVRGLVVVTPQAKAEWDIALVERRLSEMKEVGSLESVSSETKEFARGNVRKYTERVQKRIAEFDDNDDDERALEVAENLAHVLQTHERELLDGMNEEDDDSDDDEDEANVVETNEIKQDNKESFKLGKVIKRVRMTVTTNINASSTFATSTSLVNIKNSSTSTVREEGKHEDIEDDRRKKNDTESLEKTINDIREIRENLEKKNKEKKAEYERRKESREEEGKKDDEQETYFSNPSSEQER